MNPTTPTTSPAATRRPLRTWLPPSLIAPIATYAWWRSGHAGAAVIAAFSTILLASALLAPRVHAPVQRLLDRFAQLVLQLVTWLLLGLLFFLVFVPGRIALLVLRRDPMARRKSPGAASYLEATPPPRADRFSRQF